MEDEERSRVSIVWRAVRRFAVGRLLAGLGVGCAVLAGLPAQADNLSAPGLWRVTGPKGSLHLMGSVHVLTEADNWMDTPINAAFAGSDCLALEIDLATIGPEDISASLLAAGTYGPDSGGLKDHVSPKTYRRFLRMTDELALSPESLDRYRPWLVGLIFTSVITRSLGYEDEYGVDYAFAARAQAVNKPVVGLESLNDQVAVLSDSVGESDDQVLNEVLDAVGREPRLVKVLADAWRRGDMDTIARKVDEELADYPGDYDRLIGKRNRAWMAHLEKMLETGRRCMVVVGAGHLVGEASLLTLLQNAGYAVTRE